MKKLLIIVFICLPFLSKAVAIVSVTSDTTINGTWNLNNSILRISAKISGTCTITNAIIEANEFIQIFDTTVTIGAGVKIQRFSAYWFGAKTSSLNNSTPLQRAIDNCINRYELYIPAGIWNIATPLVIGVWDGSTWQQAQLKMYGAASFWDIGAGTQIYYTGSNRFAINLQHNKGSELHHLRFTGKWISPGFGLTDLQYFTIPFASYNNQGTDGNCAGIAIDNYGTGVGSTGLFFHEIIIENFEKLIEISNNTVSNGEILIFQNIQLGDGKIGVQTSQAQEKGNVFRGLYCWGRLHTLLSIGNAGKSQAGQYAIDGANIAGSVIRLFWITAGGWFPTSINNFYAEHFYTIGNLSSSFNGLPINISKSVFDFAMPSEVGTRTQLVSDVNSVKFDNCVFRFYGESGNHNMQSATFENCFFSGNVIGASNIFIQYYPAGYQTTSTTRVVTNVFDTVRDNKIKVQVRSSNRPMQ